MAFRSMTASMLVFLVLILVDVACKCAVPWRKVTVPTRTDFFIEREASNFLFRIWLLYTIDRVI